MSSILKALKKLEEQKAPRPQYELDLSSGIMRERRRGRQRRWVIPTGMAAIAVAAAITTYAVMQLQHHPTTGEEARLEAAPAALPTPPRTPAAPVVQVTGAPASTSSQPTVTPQQKITVRPAAAVTADAPSAPASVRQQKNAAAAAALPVRPAVQTGPVMSPATASPPHMEQGDTPADRMPKLKLSGIAWQQDSASRYAVVNGVAVSEGSTIDGAKIDEILPDKVRFSMAGRTFEVPMGHFSPTN